MSEPKDDKLSNGVALGVWANPAGNKLTDLKISFEDMVKNSDTYKEMKARAEKSESDNIELKEKNDLYSSMLDDERANSKKNWLNLKSDLAAKTAAVEELVRAIRILRGYSRHHATCERLMSGECSCNFEKIVEMFDFILTKHAKGT